VQLRFSISREDAHFGTSGFMCPFEMASINSGALGLKSEVSLFLASSSCCVM